MQWFPTLPDPFLSSTQRTETKSVSRPETEGQVLVSSARHDICEQFKENTAFDMSANTDFKKTGSESAWCP
jgi:hypothetical protein